MTTETTTTKAMDAENEGKRERKIPPHPSRILEKRQHDAQERFLELFSRCGVVSVASAAAGVGRRTVYDWDRGDVQGFTERWEDARHTYREAAEAQMDERLADPTGNRGSDILLMFKLKALYPEKYREAVVVVDDTAKRLLDRLGRRKARQEALGETEVGGEKV